MEMSELWQIYKLIGEIKATNSSDRSSYGDGYRHACEEMIRILSMGEERWKRKLSMEGVRWK